MRFSEAALQYFEYLDTEVFCGRHDLGEFLQHIQILQVVAGDHFPFDNSVEIKQVADHSGLIVDLAAYGDFKSVVVAVSVGIVAFTVGGLIFVGGHARTVQAVRGGEAVAAGEMGFHDRLPAFGSRIYSSP
jgi:hypothetical protein